jgi:hypothetical protein
LWGGFARDFNACIADILSDGRIVLDDGSFCNQFLFTFFLVFRLLFDSFYVYIFVLLSCLIFD